MVYKVKDLIEIAEAEGWVMARIRGDHRQFKKKGCRTLTIPGKLNDDVPTGTAKSIIRQIEGSK